MAAEPLPTAVTALLRGSGLPLAAFGIDVQSVDRADTAPLLALNAEQPFLLASTTKLVTSLAALDLLGKERRWRTAAHSTARLVDGRLGGDLVIDGGDVGLTAPELRRWFRLMRDEGLDEIAGNIILRDVALLHDADPRQARATAEELMPDAPPEARAYNSGKLLVSVQSSRGERATVSVRPRPVNVVLVNDVLMGGGSCNAWARWKSPEEVGSGAKLQLWVRGRWDQSCGREDVAFVPPPAEMRLAPELGATPVAPVAAPRMVETLWAEAGGRLRGRVIETAAGPASRARGGWTSEVATPLAEVIREMNKTSNNDAAQSLLLALGDGSPRSKGALESALARVHGWLRGQGLTDGDIRVAVGSGRSRAERGKPRAMVELLRSAWTSAGSQVFVDSLPIAGVDGTLLHRMRSGAASGQAYLKTGTLSDTRALAGYVRGKSGKVYAVTAIVSHPQAARGTASLDALIQWIASHG